MTKATLKRTLSYSDKRPFDRHSRVIKQRIDARLACQSPPPLEMAPMNWEFTSPEAALRAAALELERKRADHFNFIFQ